MSASASSDSWILIALTIFVVLLLFYLSKKMICNSYYGGEQGPTAQSPSSSSSFSSSCPYAYASASNSTSFSDYYCGGSSPFDPGEVSSAAPSSSADDFDGIDRVYRDNPQNAGTESSWRIAPENERSYNNSNNENNINNVGLQGGICTPLNVERGERSTSSFSSLSAGQRLYSETRPPTISIISSEDMQRKTFIEGQLRNQIIKIVQAEREIQRLVRLLATEQGMDYRQYLRAAARASLRPDMRFLYSNADHSGISSASTNSSGTLERSTSPSSLRREATLVEATVQSQSSAPSAVPPIPTSPTSLLLSTFKNNDDMPSLSHSDEISSTRTPPHSPLPLNDDDKGDEDDDHDPPFAQLHQNDALRVGNEHEQNERSLPNLSNFFFAPQNTNQVVCTPSLSASGIDPRSRLLLPEREYGHHHDHCQCNLCNTSTRSFSSGRIRRMLLLRQMLLPISSSFQVESETRYYTRRTRSDLLSTPSPPLTSCRFNQRENEQPVLQLPPVHNLLEQHSPISEDEHHLDNDDDPPTYEECIRSTSTYDNNNTFQVCIQDNQASPPNNMGGMKSIPK